jgi:hypothetical protein
LIGRNSDEKEKMLVENNIQTLAEEWITVAENPSVRHRDDEAAKSCLQARWPLEMFGVWSEHHGYLH